MYTLIRPFRKFIQFFIDRPYKSGVVIHHRYQVLDMIGFGSFGLVYKCLDLEVKRTVALKQLRLSKQMFKKERALFEQEVRMLAFLHHPAIPKLLEYHFTKDKMFYVMEYINGKNMAEIIFEEKRQFDEKNALMFIHHLLEVVMYLHEQDIYHGDLRIPNIMIKREKPVLIDLGLAFCLNPQMVSTTTFSQTAKRVDKMLLIQEDYYDMGDLLLFLLYTGFNGKSKKALPWTEELSLHPATTHLLERLLGITSKYVDGKEIIQDLDLAILEATNE